MNSATRRLFVVGGLVGATVLVISSMAFAGWGAGPGMTWSLGWMWLMPLMMVGFWGLVILAVVASVQAMSRPRDIDSHSESTGSAREILDRRYAGGEIDREEYEQKKRDLA
ncbi:MAG: SHOCT domain-containing protein [Chloroflexi bacterium]|nr:SHOCT domain-containing protein [Chloroflexota bacterium]